MITFKPVIYEKRKDGTRPVAIRVTFKRKRKYIKTTIVATDSDLTRGGKIKGAELLAQTNEICDRLRREAGRLNPFDLEARDADWVVARLSEAMRAQDFRLDFFVWADQFVQTKTAGNRPKYDTALRAFERYLGRRSIDINEISHALLVGFAEDCDSGNKLGYDYKTGGVRDTGIPRTRKISPQYLSRLSHIYDAAKDRFNDEDGGAVVIPRSPFRKLDMTPPKPTSGQKPLPVEVIQRMIDADVSSLAQRRALDAFVVGFALMGANMADLFEARPQKGRWWAYNRRKTRERRADGAFIKCEIPTEIRPFLARLGAGARDWWLPLLRGGAKNAANASKMINEGLRGWAKSEGLLPFTYYAGRHSWATIARRIGIEKATVDEALGHIGDFKIADIYAERDWERIADANRRVLALFRWPE